jgi:hypothetical protein
MIQRRLFSIKRVNRRLNSSRRRLNGCLSRWHCDNITGVHPDKAFRLVTDVPVVASSGQKFACGAGSAGSLCGESETFCDEAGTKVS